MKTQNSGLNQGGADADRELGVHRLRGGVLVPQLHGQRLRACVTTLNASRKRRIPFDLAGVVIDGYHVPRALFAGDHLERAAELELTVG